MREITTRLHAGLNDGIIRFFRLSGRLLLFPELCFDCVNAEQDFPDCDKEDITDGDEFPFDGEQNIQGPRVNLGFFIREIEPRAVDKPGTQPENRFRGVLGQHPLFFGVPGIPFRF